MPVPKKRVGHSEQAHRRANWKAILATQTQCTHCGSMRLSHCICTNCGFYRGQLISQKLHSQHEH